MMRAHKIRLHPTEEQKHYFARAAGTARFVWNWALAEWNRQYTAGEKPTAFKLKKQFNAIKREQFPWTWEVTKNASDQPILDLGKAFSAFFEGKAHRPRFKSKKRNKPSFYLANDQFELGDHRVWFPKLGCGLDVRPKWPSGLGAVGIEAATTKFYAGVCQAYTCIQKLEQ
jgi:putative transposase